MSGRPPRPASERSFWRAFLILLAAGQGLGYIATGLWPLVHMRSFQRVTGPKVDGWLVNTVGLLISIGGCVMLLAAARRRIGLEIGALAAGMAAALSAVDLHYVSRRRISRVYLLDAVAEGALLTAWLVAGVSRLRRSARSRSRSAERPLDRYMTGPP